MLRDIRRGFVHKLLLRLLIERFGYLEEVLNIEGGVLVLDIRYLIVVFGLFPHSRLSFRGRGREIPVVQVALSCVGEVSVEIEFPLDSSSLRL